MCLCDSDDLFGFNLNIRVNDSGTTSLRLSHGGYYSDSDVSSLLGTKLAVPDFFTATGIVFHLFVRPL
jgi:hypothetical protein